MSPTLEIAGRPVNRVGFGAMQLPGPHVFGPPRDREAALAVLRRAVELGANHIDTAQFYGPDVANELIHTALHPYPGDLVLVSKVGARRDGSGAWLPAQRPEELRAGVEENLRALEIERLDAVNLRRHPHSDVPLEEQLGEMHALRAEGKIAGVGLSNVTLEQLEAGLAAGPVACVQNAFNLQGQEDRPVLERCTREAIPYVPFFPLGSGFTPRRVTDLPAVGEVAARLELTPAQVVLAWTLAQGEHLLLIPGTSSLAHLEENMAAGEVELDAATLAELDAAGAARPRKANVSG